MCFSLDCCRSQATIKKRGQSRFGVDIVRIRKRVLEVYRHENGKEPFTKWLISLGDLTTRARIRRRLARLEEGNWGDIKPVGGGVFELRFDFGPGYRVYLGERDETLVILLCGGDKSSQDADIRKAKELWQEFKESQS